MFVKTSSPASEADVEDAELSRSCRRIFHEVDHEQEEAVEVGIEVVGEVVGE